MARRLGLLLCVAALAWLAPGRVCAEDADAQYTAAAGLYAKREWKQAAEAFEGFLQAHPEHERKSAAAFYLGESQVQLGQYDAARVQFQAVVAAEPEGRFARQAQFRAGECSYLSGQAEAAARELATFCEKYPDDELLAFALPYRGEMALADGKRDEARGHFEAALARFPEGVMRDDCRYGLARIAEAEGRPADAAVLYEQVAGTKDGALADEAQFQAGAARYAAKDYAAASSAFAKLVEQWPESPLADRARLARGWALFHEQKFGEAKAQFAGLVDHAEQGITARYWLGLTQRALADWKGAADVLLEAEAKAPEHELAAAMLYHAGDALVQAGEHERAAETLQKVIDGWPDGPWRDDAHAALVQSAATRGDHEAVDRLTAALASEDPASPLLAGVRRAQARSQIERKQFAEAIATLEAVLAGATLAEEQTSGPADAAMNDRYMLAVAYQGLARHDEALAALAPVLGAGDADLARHARLLQASLLVGSGRHAEAIGPLEQLLADEQFKDKAGALAQLAVCQAKTGKLPPARETLAKLRDAGPATELLLSTTRQLAEAAEAAGEVDWASELYTHLSGDDVAEEFAAVGLSGLGWIHYRAGRLNEAEATFDRLVAKYPNHALAPAAALARGQVLETLERPDGALAMYRRVIEREPATTELPEALLRAARLHERLAQHDEAIGLYERFAAEFPAHEQADAGLYEAAWVLRGVGRHDEADGRLVRLRSEFPQSRFWPDATYRLAERAHQTQELKRAGELLVELLGRGPQRPVLEHALYLQGQVAAAEARWDDVERSMQQLVSAAPEASLAPLAEFWIAEAAYRRNEFETAGERFATLAGKVAGRREPWVAMVALRQGQVLGQQNRWAEAQAAAEAVLRDWPELDERFEAEYLLGRALAALGEYEPAREAYRRVIRSPKGNKSETAAMAQWMIGESHFHQKNYDAALREYLRLEVLYAYPTWQAGALLQAGKCHEQLGEWKEASEVYARLLQNYGQTPFAEEAAGRLRTAQGRPVETR